MLRVTVELIEHGVGKPKTLSQMSIVNDGSGTAQSGNYDVELVGPGLPSEVATATYVRGFPRREGHLELVFAALLNLLEEPYL